MLLTHQFLTFLLAHFLEKLDRLHAQAIVGQPLIQQDAFGQAQIHAVPLGGLQMFAPEFKCVA